MIARRATSPLREDGIDEGQEHRCRGAGVSGIEAEFPDRTSREGSNSDGVPAVLLAANVSAPRAGRSQRGEVVAPLGRCSQRAVDEGPKHLLERVGAPDLGGQLLVQVCRFTPVDGTEQLVQVGEVLVDQRAADPGSLGDGLHGNGLEVARHHELDRSVEQGLAPFRSQQIWQRHFAGPYVAVWDGLRAAFEGARQLLSFQQQHVYFPIATGSPDIAASHNLIAFAFLLAAVPLLIGVLRMLPFAYGAYVIAAYDMDGKASGRVVKKLDPMRDKFQCRRQSNNVGHQFTGHPTFIGHTRSPNYSSLCSKSWIKYLVRSV